MKDIETICIDTRRMKRLGLSTDFNVACRMYSDLLETVQFQNGVLPSNFVLS